MNFTISVKDRWVIKCLCCFVVGFLLAGAISHSLKYDFDHMPALYSWFNTDGEKNFPTAFSCGLLLLSSALIFLITAYKKSIRDRFTAYWCGLGLLFVALATDEWLSFHEKLSDVIGAWVPTSGIFHFAWIIGGIAFLCTIGLIYWRFLQNLPSPYRFWFIRAAFVFVLGAIGIEMLAGYYVESHQQWNRNIWLALTTLEEGLEMFGIVLFIRALLSYIQEFVGDITLQVGPSQPTASALQSRE